MQSLTHVRALYLCYFGVREPLVNTQVLPYLAALALCGAQLTLLTFEPNLGKFSETERAEVRARLKQQGIEWICRAYHKRPTLPATLYDIFVGAWTALRLIRKRRINFLHARSHVPALMAAMAKKFSGVKFLFDIRGLMADEYVDAGVWPANGFLYCRTKSVERKLLREADGFVVLTQTARELLFPASHPESGKKMVEVIPCCADLKRFTEAKDLRHSARLDLGWEDRRVLLYLGALNGWYLSEEMAQFFAAAYQSDRKNLAVLITQSDGSAMAKRLVELGVPENDFTIRAARPEQVPMLLAAADIAISFIKPSFSKKASSPTKIGEYLASGLPVLSNLGIGDMDEVIAGERVGVLLREFSNEAYLAALGEMNKLLGEAGIHERCRETAQRHFDLETVGAERYARLYAKVMDAATPEERP